MAGNLREALEALMHHIKMFNRNNALNLDGFKNSGADWLTQYKPYIEDGKTVITRQLWLISGFRLMR